MKEPRHDDERLAALLEGRLEGPERDELLAYLATADEDLYVFAKTAAALREMEEDEAERAQQAAEQETQKQVAATLPPSAARPGWRRWKASRVIVPPVLAGLLALGILTARGGARYAGNPVQLAASLDKPMSEEWMRNRVWSPERGEGGIGGTRGAARAGALLVDLSVAIQTRDSSATANLAEEIRTDFDVQAAPSSPIRIIERDAGAPRSELEPLLREQTDRLAERLKHDDYLRLGAWTEAAMLAVADSNAAFFRSRDTRTMLRRAERITPDNQEARAAAAQVRVQLEAQETLDWQTLDARLRALMKAITD